MPKPKIMVIDDSKTVLISVKVALQAVGCDVLTRDVAVGATGYIMREKPDLLLLDVNMPAMDGPVLVEMMRRHSRMKDTPVILYSSESDAELDRKVKECGANGHLCKSGNLDALRRLVQEFLRDKSALHKDSPSVLFVDDDIGMLRSFRRILDDQFAGMFVSTPQEALDCILSDTPPAVVITDLVMPGFSGIELYERAVQADERWRRRFVFVTGLAADDDFDKKLAASGQPVLRKPLLEEQVTRLLESIGSLTAAA